jgi:hypothetical protein
MKKLIPLFLLFSSLALAQTPTKPSDPAVPAAAITAPVVATPAPAPAPAVDAAPAAPATDAAAAPAPGDKISDADMKEILDNANEVLAAYRTVKTTNGSKAKLLAIFAGLAILFKLLLSLLKVVIKADFWKGDKAKWIIRCTTAVLGLAVFLCANLGAGVPWLDAVMLGLSGPFAIVVHEFTSKPRVDEAKKA